MEGYQDLSAKHEKLILQEKVRGKIVGYFAFFDENSQEIAWFNHRRVRQFPIEGGPSSFCESHFDALATRYGRRLLQSLNWRGLAMVEFVEGDSDSGPKLLEVNPRLWGSTPLAVNAGVDFPYIWFQKSLGLPVNKISSYKHNIRIRFLPKDLLAVAAEVKNEDLKIKRLFSGLLDLLDPGVKDGVFRLKDLKPALGYLQKLFKSHDETI
jgi:predicted ATP-grasp superfamily ATP-dependent carboligase